MRVFEDEDELIESEEAFEDDSVKGKTKIHKRKGGLLFWLIELMIVIAIVYVGIRVFLNISSHISSSYESAFSEAQEAAYQNQYWNYYKKAEEAYHVANRVTISVGQIKEQAKLEVLRVTDVEYVIEKENGLIRTNAWIEVPGKCIYTVDLQAAEFIVDNARSYVLVRAPYPERTEITIDYQNIKELLFVGDKWIDGSNKRGEELARKQISEADILIKKEFASNQQYYISAQKAAQTIIEYMVCGFNPEVKNLKVEVEFF